MWVIYMMAEKIRIAMIKKNVALKELAAYLGCTSQNLSMKLKQDNLREKELQQIAEFLDCSFEGRFIRNDTGEEI